MHALPLGMLSRPRLALLLALVCAAAACSADDGANGANGAGLAAGDTGLEVAFDAPASPAEDAADATITCTELRDRLDQLADDPANRICTDDNDCTLVGGTDGCNCRPHLSRHCGGRAVSRPVPAALAELLALGETCEGDRWLTCDCGPSEVGCLDGLCSETRYAACGIDLGGSAEGDAEPDLGLETDADAGIAPQPGCELVYFAPNPWLFEGEYGDAPLELTGTLVNDRSAAVEVLGLSLAGTNPFEIVSPPTPVPPFEIGPESSVGVTVRFLTPGSGADAQLDIVLADCATWAYLQGS